MTDVDDPLGSAFQELSISDDSTRSSASKAKNTKEFHMCTECFVRFHLDQELQKHLKTVHKSSSKQICSSYQEHKIKLQSEPDEVNKHNFQLSLLKVSCLTKIRRKKL
jgi:hypothetical protein